MRTQPTSRSYQVSTTGFLNKVYLFMTLGLLLTALVAFYFHTHVALSQIILKSSFAFYAIVIVQLGAVFLFSNSVRKMNASSAFLLFFLYSALSGVTFGLVSFMYTTQNIGYAFAITAGSFFGLSLVGYTTKKDLSPIASFCTMGLIGLILISVLALFIPGLRSETMNLVMGAIGVIVFSGLTAYDTQKIKMFAAHTESQEIAAINGAFMLYLDFINLFLSILRLFGDRR